MSAPMTSLLPPMTGALLPAPTVQGLSDDEQRLVQGLSAKLTFQSTAMRLRWFYYDGLQRMQNLGVSIPPQMSAVRTVVDWPRVCCDPLVMRAVFDGFRMPGATDVDDELLEHLQANDFESELPLSLLDSLVTGRGYIIVGSPDVPGDSPVVTVESPLNLALNWDPRSRRVTSAYQSYEIDGIFRAVLYVPGQTVLMSREQFSSGWVIADRDVHGFDEVPVVRLPNRARSSDREGRSEITAAIMNTTDSACRSLLGMEIAREFYSIPHRYILGATESDFVDSSGKQKTALDMAMNKFLALERDEEGNVPTVGQFTAFDPSVFTKIIDEHAQLMASYTGFPPAYFGQTTTANPASADAIRLADNGIERAADRVTRQSTGPLRKVGQLIWRFANGGKSLPDEVRRLEVDWADTATATPAGTSDAMLKQAQMGAVSSTSDVVLKRLGYTALERQRLEQDRLADEGAQFLEQVAHSEVAKTARSDNTLTHDLTGAKTPPSANVQPPPV